MIKIAKFGGSSVADAEHFKKIKAIVDADPARRFVVVSACGRRFKGDTKVTDLLYLVSAHVKYHVSCEDLLKDIGQRYFDIADGTCEPPILFARSLRHLPSVQALAATPPRA